jgi:hypothetical protein
VAVLAAAAVLTSVILDNVDCTTSAIFSVRVVVAWFVVACIGDLLVAVRR